MNLIGRYIILLLTGCYSQALSGQQLAYRHFGINEGLPHSELYAICQGPDKTLWISTDNGLSHYDGNFFTNYNPKNVTGSNYVLDALFLPDGRLLVNSYRKGLCFSENGKFVNATVMADGFPRARAQLGGLYTLTYDTVNRCVWAISAGHALIRFVVTGNTLTVKQHWIGNINYWVHVDTITKTTYICNEDGLSFYNNGNLVPACNALKGKPITKIMSLDANTLLLATTKSILLYNKQLKTVGKETYFDGSNLHYEYFMYDTLTRLCWIPDKAGGVKVFQLQQPQKLLYHLLPEVNVNYLFADGQGNVWCCSYGSGLFQFPQLSILNYNAVEGLRDHYVTHIGGNNPLIISCLKSYYQFDRLANKFTILLETDVRKPHNKSTLLPNGELGFLNAQYILNQKGKVLANYHYILYDVAILQQDTVLLGGFMGLTTVNGAYKEIKNNFLLPPVSIYKTVVNGDSILLATSDGVFVRSYGTWQHYNEKNGLPDNIVHDIKATNGKLYVAGRSGMAMIERNGLVRVYDKVEVGNTSIVGLAVDEWDGIWMATGNGLYLDYKNVLYRFDQYDGLIANDITGIYALDGKLYTGTTQGMSAIDLAALYAELGQARPCFLKAVLSVVDGANKKPIANGMQLSPNENDVQLNIVGPDFYHPQQRILEYSLDGGFTWSSIVNRQLDLPSLGYGKYHLQVRTKLRNEKQFQILANYQFRINLPWYRNVFFIISVVFLLLSLAGLLFWRYYKQKNKRAVQQLQVKQQVLDLKQKAMAAMLNPHFVFNSINSINYYIHNGEEEKYTLLLTDLSRLIRLNLNNTYQDSVTLASELEIIELYVQFEKHRFIRHPLAFSLQYQSNLSAQQIKIPAMMLQPFVENAIWHGVLPKQGGHVQVTVSDTPDSYLLITIQDDGAGCDPAKLMAVKQADVRGVGLIQERIQAYNSLHNKPIILKLNMLPQGFSVQLYFPLT